MSEYTAEQYVKDYCRRNHEDARRKEDWLKEVKNTEEWAKEHPEPHIETNGEHYKKEFGHENITTWCYVDEETLRNCDSECETCRYNADAPYHAPESVLHE